MARYRSNATSNRLTHTITMPVSALVDDPDAHSRARVVISPVGREESVLSNNEFTVYLGGRNALRLAKQPADAIVQEGETASFDVEVSGGAKPYAFQWQVWNPEKKKWVNLKGFTEPAIAREKVEKQWDGARFRCVVTDAEGTRIVSEEAVLTVRDRVPTGDNSNLPLYLAIAMAALALLWWMRRRAAIKAR